MARSMASLDYDRQIVNQAPMAHGSGADSQRILHIPGAEYVPMQHDAVIFRCYGDVLIVEIRIGMQRGLHPLTNCGNVAGWALHICTHIRTSYEEQCESKH